MSARTILALTLLNSATCDAPTPPPTPAKVDAPPTIAAPPTITAPPAARVRPTAPATAGATPATHAAVPAITEQARLEYRTRLEAGRKLAKATKWAEAIVEFDAALVAIPGDDRALGELSWAAFSAGDFARAKQAAHASVRAATAPKVKGAALYNLGRAEEASGNLAEARAAYEASIAARPNTTVSARLAALAAPAAAEPLACATPASIEAVCACLSATVDAAIAPDQPTCSASSAGVDGFQFATYTLSEVGESRTMIVAQQGTLWGVVAEMAYVYDPGMMGISEEWTQQAAVERTIGAHRLVEFRGHKARSDSDMGIDEIETEDTDVLVVCVRGEADEPTTCPLQLVTKRNYVRERLAMDDDPEVDALRTPGLPIRSGHELAVEIGEDGVAKVRRIAGEPDGVALGDTKLW